VHECPGLRFSHWSMLGIHPTAPKAQAMATATGSGTGYGPRPKEVKTQAMATGSGTCSGTGPEHGLRPWPKAQARSQLRHWPRTSSCPGIHRPRHMLWHGAKAHAYALASGPCSGFTQRLPKPRPRPRPLVQAQAMAHGPREPKRRPWPLVQAHALALAQSTGFGHGQRPKHARSSGTGRVQA
jgi:hypothetical protein